MLNVGRLEILRAVVEHGSFSAAAEALSYTQSAVSQAIARLESETRTTLVIRGRRGVTATEAGALLVSHAERIAAAIALAEDELAAISGEHLTRLRLASFPSGGATLMPNAVARLRRTHPGVALTLVEGEPAEIVPRLRAGDLDMALLFDFPRAPAVGRPSPRPRASAGLRSVTLLEDPMDLVLPVGHPLAARRQITLADLRRQSWVQTSAQSPCARHVVASCVNAGFHPDVTFESDDYETVQGLVAAGVGVALIPRLALEALHPGLVVRALHPHSPVRRVTVATPSDATLPPIARTMIDVLAEVARRHLERAEGATAARAGIQARRA
jgi:DNA-binding transcriptional LysR family regulator